MDRCRAIAVGYAYKKDTKGERHGTPAERLLAEQMRKNLAAQSRPNTLFATGDFPLSGYCAGWQLTAQHT